MVRDLDHFAAAATPVWSTAELEHCLPLGVIERLRAHSAADRPSWDGIVVTEHGRVVTAALRTRDNVLVVGAAPPEAITAVAGLSAAALRPLKGVTGPAASATWFAEAWRRDTGQVMELFMALRVHACDRAVHGAVRGAARPASDSDADVLADWIEAFADEALGDEVDGQDWAARYTSLGQDQALLWTVDHEPVAMAAMTRPTATTMAINTVYTPPEHRGRGYGGAVVAACTDWITGPGGKDHAVLFTDLANSASNRAYTRVGFRPVGDALELRTPTSEQSQIQRAPGRPNG